jgi:ATP-dependent Lon protease
VERLPILPLGKLVVYPHVVLPLSISDPRAMQLLDEVVQADKRLLLGVVRPRDNRDPDEGPLMHADLEDLYDIGTLGLVVRMLKLMDGTMRVMIQGVERVALQQPEPYGGYLVAAFEPLATPGAEDPRVEPLKRNVVAQFGRVIDLAPYLAEELHEVLEGITDPGKLADFVAANLDLALPARVELLSLGDIPRRLERLAELLAEELQVLEVGSQIQEKVKAKLDEHQREYVLREQLRVIRQELGEDSSDDDLEDLITKLDAAGLSAEARRIADRELRRLKQMSPQSAEYHVARTYLEVIAALPWDRLSPDRLELKAAREILDRDHYDLAPIKDRILEHLAVRTLNPDAHGSILCFVGPPGVGKTSLGKSIARALGRKFTRLSLGGVHDEAEIRGHRRTYIGALPGQIIQGIRRAETNDPVFMLDEVDKLGRDWRGDPSSALLETLDPEQNNTFRDNYLDVPFDLSKVLFITTANQLDPVPDPLRDRMEIIELPGYTEDEKVHIAQRYLVPRQIDENGLKPEQIEFPEESIRHIIRHYTREAGVRNLERNIGTICRKQARRIAEGKPDKLVVSNEDIKKFLGGEKIRVETEIAERTKRPGVAVGLAWTPTGGDVLFVEVNKMKGKGNFTMTGQIGQVMQESMQAALTWVRSHAQELGVAEDFFSVHDLHIHVPAGAIPKDGPSAGITMVTAIVSLLTDRSVRPYMAMTGEITLSGNVLPVGGIKEKFLAAKRVGVHDLILPGENKMNVEEDILPEQLAGVTVHYVSTIDEALAIALPTSPTEEKKDAEERERHLQQVPA